jgi:ABC-type polar amino acid transport system ATPase subunit
MKKAIEVRGLQKSFKKLHVLKGVDFEYLLTYHRLCITIYNTKLRKC